MQKRESFRLQGRFSRLTGQGLIVFSDDFRSGSSLTVFPGDFMFGWSPSSSLAISGYIPGFEKYGVVSSQIHKGIYEETVLPSVLALLQVKPTDYFFLAVRIVLRGEKSCKFPLFGSTIYGLQGGNNRRWSQKSLSTNTEGKNILSRKTNNIGQQIADVASLTHNTLNTSRVEISESKSIHIEEKISENNDISKLITIIVFDIETTGFSREKDRIIEIALQDLSGGENSTFQTLVNPDKYVLNSHIHGISSYMVNKPGVPRSIALERTTIRSIEGSVGNLKDKNFVCRMKDLIPILVQYIKSRQKPGGQILLIAHNAKAFDVPFLISEFSRCSLEIPLDWYFMDTMSPAREVKKREGSKLASNSLQALREHYEIQEMGKAHRAMADVSVLALVLQRMTRDLKLTVPGLVQNYAFTASEIINNSKKKKNSK
ncbi:Exonuclease [Cynara cardunculus var. scolymus]|uniref:Exonuclease n=1 Tax=Cynara cardunculus var. scolymus TaxID=59895 RepID=A0A103YKW7_CYNCS|nr:Exonuclease [Cynara cardunculus var. scolymus]